MIMIMMTMLMMRMDILFRHGEADDQLEKLLPEVVARVEAVCDTLR